MDIQTEVVSDMVRIQATVHILFDGNGSCQAKHPGQQYTRKSENFLEGIPYVRQRLDTKSGKTLLGQAHGDIMDLVQSQPMLFRAELRQEESKSCRFRTRGTLAIISAATGCRKW